MNSPCGDRKGPAQALYGHIRRPCVIFAILVLSIPLRVRKDAVRYPWGPPRAPYGSCRIWRTLEIPVWGPHDSCTGITRGLFGVLRIIPSNHKCKAVSSRTGPAAWCDHENSTGVKFLWALQTALRGTHGPPYGCRRIWKALKILVLYPWSPANYSTKPWVRSRVKPYGARSLMWSREQHRRKIVKFLRAFHSTLRPSNFTGGKNRTGPWLDVNINTNSNCDVTVVSRVSLERACVNVLLSF